MQPTPQPDARPVPVKRRWWEFWKPYWLYELKAPYVRAFFHDGHWYMVKVPEGYRFDGASYSRFWFGRDGLHRAAVLWHDYCHEHRGAIPRLKAKANKSWVVSAKAFSRNEMNQIFRNMMIEDRVPNYVLRIPYKAVQALDWIWWRGG